MATFWDRSELDPGFDVRDYRGLLDSGEKFGPEIHSADFHRDGDDLLLRFADGSETLIRGFFSEEQPFLLTEEGGLIDAETITALLRPDGPLLYAQQGEVDTGGFKRIGEVREAEGQVQATRPDGTVVRLGVGDDVYQGDILATGADGKVGIIFVDGTVFSLGQSGRMTLNNLVFDPSGDSAMSLSVLQGTFVFLSGEVAGSAADGMTVRTPIIALGVRGTQVGGTLENGVFTLFPDQDTGDVGVVTLTNLGGQVVLDDPFESTEVTGFFSAPSPPFIPPPAQIEQLFSEVQQPLARLTPIREDFIETEEQRRDEDSESGGDGGAPGEGETDGETQGEGGGDQEGAAETEGGGLADAPETEGSPAATGLAAIEPAAGDDAAPGGDPAQGTPGDQQAAGLPPAPTPANVVQTSTQDVGVVQTGDGSPASGPTATGPGPADTGGGTAGGEPATAPEQSTASSENPSVQGDSGTPPASPPPPSPPPSPPSPPPPVFNVIEGTAGNDVLVGTEAADQISGLGGDDQISGGAGDDILSGGAGNDTLVGGEGEGNDTLDGGEGTDLGQYTSTTGAVSIDLQAGSANGSETGSDVLTGLENISTGSGNDFIGGNAQANLLDGGAGNDTLIGRGGNDTLVGGAGDGDVAQFSGSFSDYLIEADGDGLIVTDLAPGTNGDDGSDLLLGIEILRFADGDGLAIAGNQPPVAADDGGTGFLTDEDSAFTTANVLANDSDIDDGTLSVVGLDTADTLGQVTDNGDGSFTYDPGNTFQSLGAGEQAFDSFDYTLSDGQGGFDTATVTITITGVNDDPVANNDPGIGTAFQTPVTIDVLANDSDVDDDPLTVSIVGDGPANGQAVVEPDGRVTYTPDDGFSGQDSFTYQVDDGNGGTDTALVTVTVTENPAPLAVDDSFAGDEDNGLAGNVLADNGNGPDSDPDDDPLSVSAVNGAAAAVGNQIALSSGALLTLNADGSFAYDPGEAFQGLGAGEQDTDSFDYTITDGNDGFDTATVTITIAGVNDDPVAGDDPAVGTAFETPVTIDVLANDSDVDDDPLTVSIVGDGPANGQAVVEPDGQITYTPEEGFGGQDSFTYQVDDGNGGTDTALVTVTVAGSGLPLAVDDSFAGDEDNGLAGNVLANNGNGPDSDPDGGSLSVSAVNGVAAAVGNQIVLSSGALLTLNADGSFAYDPNGQFDSLAAGQQDTDSFEYTITDGQGGFDTATVTIAIAGVDDMAIFDLNGPPIEDGVNNGVVFTEGNGPILLASPDAVIDDPDLDDQIVGAEVTLTLRQPGEESLEVDTSGTDIVASYNAETGVLSLTGAASRADYEQVLKTVAYRNSSENPTLSGSATDRGISFRVDTGSSLQPSSAAIVLILALNDAPVIAAPVAEATRVGDDLLFSAGSDNGITITDVDTRPGIEIEVTLTGLGGTVSLSQTSGLSFSAGDGLDDTLTTFIGSLANINAALDGLTFSADGTLADASLAIDVSDRGFTGDPGPLTADQTIDIAVSGIGPGDGDVIITPELIVVGDTGLGTLNLSQGDSLVAQDMIIGRTATGNGRVTLTDSQILLTPSLLVVGDAGTGLLEIGANSQVVLSETGQVFIGREAGSDGRISLIDGGFLDAGQEIFIGMNEAGENTGTGFLEVVNGNFDFTSFLGVGANGELISPTLSIGGNGRYHFQDGAQVSLNIDQGINFRVNSGQVSANPIDNGNDIVGTAGATLTGIGTELRTLGVDNTVQVGREAGTTGTMLIENGASLFTSWLEVGREGTGVVVAQGDGTGLLISMEDGRFSGEFVNEAGFVRAGFDDGSDGTIRLLDGAIMVITSGLTQNLDTTAPELQIARNFGSRGLVEVSGAGSRIQLQDDQPSLPAEGLFGSTIAIGRGGTGTLIVSDNATVTANSLEDGALSVGLQAGADGQLQVLSGGVVEFTSDNAGLRVLIGEEFGATGTVEVEGANSELRLLGGGGDIFAIGDAGGGVVDIRDGGRLIHDGIEPFIDVGRQQSGRGFLFVDGAGSELSIVGPPGDFSLPSLVLGREGESVAEVTGGGRIALEGSNALLTAGFLAGSTGTLFIEGIGSRVELIGDQAEVTIGSQGTGLLLIFGGGELVVDPTGQVVAGTVLGGEGTIRVAGDGSLLDAGSFLGIAATPFGNTQGTATLDVSGDADVRADEIVIGANGTVNVTGTGTSIDGPGAIEQVRFQDGAKGTFTSDNFDNFDVNTGAVVANPTDGGNDIAGTAAVILTGLGTELRTVGTDNTVQVGREAGTTGTMLIEDGASLATLQLEAGRSGTGVIVITDEGTSVRLTTQDGRFSGEFSNESGFMRAGRNDGADGTIRILNGADVFLGAGETRNTDTTAPGIQIARDFGSKGLLEVSGQGTTLTLLDTPGVDESVGLRGSFLFIGRGGDGRVIVQDQALVTLDSVEEGVLRVGMVEGGQGVLDILTGGTLLITSEDRPRVQLGNDIGSEGTVNIDGAGSELRIESGVEGSSVQLGEEGQGTVNITGGGRFIIGAFDPFVSIGDQTTGVGVLLVDGEGSLLEITGDGGFVAIGNEGRADVDITGGGQFIVQESGANDSFANISVGDNPVSQATVDIAGAGSLLQAEFIAIGALFDQQLQGFVNGGSGTVTVTDGGTLRAIDGDGSRGTILLGENGTLNFDGTANIDGNIDTSLGGTIGVIGAGTVFDRGDFFGIGVNVQGVSTGVSATLNLIDGADVRAVEIAVGANSAFNVTGAGFSIDGPGDVERMRFQDGAQGIFTSDGFDNFEVNTGAVVANPNDDGNDIAGTAAVVLTGLGTELRTIGTDNTVQVGREAGTTGTMLIEDGASLATLELEAGREGTGVVVITGEGTDVRITNQDGRFSGVFVNEAGFMSAGRDPGSNGTIRILDGADVFMGAGETQNTDATSPGLTIGRELGSRGTIEIAGAGTTLTLEDEPGIDLNVGDFGIRGSFIVVGRGGTGELIVRDGATITANSFEEGSFEVGRVDGSQGVVNITSGGQIIYNSEDDDIFASIGRFAGSQGIVNIDGVGSELRFNDDGDLDIGGAGQGIVNVTNGGKLFTNTSVRIGDDPLTVTGQVDGSVTGNGGDAANVVTINGSGSEFSTLNGTADLFVGDGGKGVLNIEDGGLVRFANVQLRGPSGLAGNGNEIRVTGDGSLLEVTTVNNELPFGPAEGGGFLRIARSNGDQGAITVENGGKIVVTSTVAGEGPGIQVAREFGSIGMLTVDGGGDEPDVIGDPDVEISTSESALLTNPPDGKVPEDGFGPYLIAGRTGAGTVLLTNRASLLVSGEEAELRVGGGNTGESDADFIPDRANLGTLRIEQGSILRVTGDNAFANVGLRENGNGKLEIDGIGSLLQITSERTFNNLGNEGIADVDITGGGQLIIQETDDVNDGAAHLHIAYQPTSIATVDIAGDGSLLRAELIAIGVMFDSDLNDFVNGGTGTVTVSDGGSLEAIQADGSNGSIVLGENATLNVDSGSTIVGSIDNDLGGTVNIGNSPGFAVVTGDIDHGGEMLFEVAGTAPGSGHDFLEVGGEASFTGGLHFAFIDGFAPLAGESFTFLTADEGIVENDDTTIRLSGLERDFAFELSFADGEGRLTALSDGTVGEAEQLFGGDGDDALTGGAGDDALFGGLGDDTLAGGGGQDVLTGGEGADRFEFALGEDGVRVMQNVRLSELGFEADVVEDFDAEEGDSIALMLEGEADALEIALGNFERLTEEYDGTNATSEGWQNGEASLFVDGEGQLIYDDNGAGEGYTVVAQTEPGSVAAEDVQISG